MMTGLRRLLWLVVMGGTVVAPVAMAEPPTTLPLPGAITSVPSTAKAPAEAKVLDAAPSSAKPVLTPVPALGTAPPSMSTSQSGPALPTAPYPLMEKVAEAEKEEHGAFLVTGDYFLLRPRRRGQDYAIIGTNPNWAPLGTVKSVEGGFDSGFRIGAGYRCPGEGWECLFLYTFFHSTGDDRISAGPGQTVFPTLTHPAFVSEVTSAQATNSINLNLFDLELARRIQLSESVDLRLFGGPRFANLDQKFQATYTGGDIGRDDVHRRLFFDGGGVRGGGEATVQFLEHFGVYLRGSASMLTGRFRSDLMECADSQAIVNVSERFDKVVPILDMGLGLRYNRGGLRLSVGYEFINWFGMVEGFDFVDDAHPSKMTRRVSDLGFDGIVFRAELAF